MWWWLGPRLLTHAHTHIHTHLHTNTLTLAHTYIRTNAHMDTHTHIYTHTNIQGWVIKKKVEHERKRKWECFNDHFSSTHFLSHARKPAANHLSPFNNRDRDHIQHQPEALLPCDWHQPIRGHPGGRVPWPPQVAQLCDGGWRCSDMGDLVGTVQYYLSVCLSIHLFLLTKPHL